MKRPPVIVVRGVYPGGAFLPWPAWWDRFGVGFVVGGVLVGMLIGLMAVAGVRAEEEPARFAPASRGPRASYQTDQVQQWCEAVDAYAWPTETALLVIACESQGDPGAVNRGSGAAGLFQLYGWSWLAERLTGSRNVFNAWVNIRTAFELWRETGSFSWHWYASIGCWGW